MDVERSTLGKSLTTHVAAIGFFACMRPQMVGQCAALKKAMAALLAAIGPLARVSPTMAVEIATRHKSPAALVAMMGALTHVQTPMFITGMRPTMADKGAALGEVLTALIAVVQLITHVHAHMLGEVTVVRKRLVALVTTEGLLITGTRGRPTLDLAQRTTVRRLVVVSGHGGSAPLAQRHEWPVRSVRVLKNNADCKTLRHSG